MDLQHPWEKPGMIARSIRSSSVFLCLSGFCGSLSSIKQRWVNTETHFLAVLTANTKFNETRRGLSVPYSLSNNHSEA